MNLTEHFTLNEFTYSDTAVRVGIKNLPNDVQRSNLLRTAGQMEKVRSILRRPIKVLSGLRVTELNRLVGGSVTSAHTQGLAVDFTCPGYGLPKDVCKALLPHMDALEIDQLIYEGGWVHIGFKRKGMPFRGDVLTANFDGGKTTYIQGV